MSSQIQKTYETFLKRAKELTILQSTTAILQWDMETKMPPRGMDLRSQQLAYLELIGHKMITDPQTGKLLEEIEKAPEYYGLTKPQKRNVYLVRKAYDEATKLPEDLVFETAKQQTISVGVWKKAKAAKDYNMFKPELKKMIELRQRAADILMIVKDAKTPYDALIDGFEPNMTTDMITAIFDEMRAGLMGIMKKVKSSGVKPDTSILTREVPVEVQSRISDAAMEFIKYDTKSANAGGRLDETEHPFTTGYYDDVRITTHYHKDRWVSSLYSVLHEGGHALYEQNYPYEYIYQPIGSAASFGIHESQSRFVENIVGKSPEFLSYMLPRLKKIVGKPLKGVNLRDFVLAVNEVIPSKIRVEADEVTYGLHIIIRFEMERDIFLGKLAVDDLPQVWNEKYYKYLGLEIENDSEGVMQDTHWAQGLHGYFPSYALGNIYGGMFLNKLKKDFPEWRKELKKGNIIPAMTWMSKNIHCKGALYDPADLVNEILGTKLTVKPFIKYLEKKYEKIYSF
jgi:carboxypeptidase Taq